MTCGVIEQMANRATSWSMRKNEEQIIIEQLELKNMSQCQKKYTKYTKYELVDFVKPQTLFYLTWENVISDGCI